MHRNLLFCLLLGLAAMGCSRPAVGIGGTDVGANYVQVDIIAEDNCVRAGEVVKLRAVATNRGKTPTVIEFQDKPVLDIRIEYSISANSRTSEITEYWSDGREVMVEDKRLELAPGESKTIAMDWVAQEGRGLSSQIELFGILRYGESESDVATARTALSVERCPGYSN